MPEITPDPSDASRCFSVHWTLPVQCVLPASHRENWHEAWHPQTGNRIRYQRSMGGYVTEELNDGWHDVQIPPPGGHCNEQYSGHFGDTNVRCTGQYGHGWNHRAIVDGCTYSWNTPIPSGLTFDQLTHDVKQLRGMLVEAHSRIAELEKTAVEARAALGSLCYDLEDPGTAALGALYLLSRATTWTESGPDFAADALARHASEVLYEVADIADPEPPEASFFGDYGPQVAAWLRRRADQKTATPKAATS